MNKLPRISQSGGLLERGGYGSELTPGKGSLEKKWPGVGSAFSPRIWAEAPDHSNHNKSKTPGQES